MKNKIWILLLPLILFGTITDFSTPAKKSSHTMTRSAWVKHVYLPHSFTAASDTMELKPDSLIWYSFFSIYIKSIGSGTLDIQYQTSPFDSTSWWNYATWFDLTTITDTCGYDISITSLISPVEYIKFRFILKSGSLTIIPVWHSWN